MGELEQQGIEAPRPLGAPPLQAGQRALADVPQRHHQGHQQGQSGQGHQGDPQAPVDLLLPEHAAGAAQATFQEAAPLFGQGIQGQTVELGVLLGDGEQGKGAGAARHQGRQLLASTGLAQEDHPQGFRCPQQAQMVGVTGGSGSLEAEAIQQRLTDPLPGGAGIAGLVQLVQVSLDHPGPLGSIRPAVAAGVHGW